MAKVKEDTKTLYGATFIGACLWGYRTKEEDASDKDGRKAIQTSRVVKREGKTIFRTQSGSRYKVHFVPGAYKTIPAKFENW